MLRNIRHRRSAKDYKGHLDRRIAADCCKHETQNPDRLPLPQKASGKSNIRGTESGNIVPGVFTPVLALGTRKLVTYISGGLWIFPSHAQYAMRSWQKGLPRSTTGFQTQAGTHFVFAAKKASVMLSGPCDFHISVAH